MRPELGRGYDKSVSQRVGAITEAWASENLYCPSCDRDALRKARTGQKVHDFTCDACAERYQLKGMARPLGGRVLDAAYGTMIEAVVSGAAPSFYFLHYDREAWRVQNLRLVPRFFLSASVIEERRPLSATARRAHYVGCNILLSRLPPDARIGIVVEEEVTPAERVREQWDRFEFLAKKEHEVRGWTADVLACVRRLPRATFSAREFYAEFEGELSDLHPRNLHVQDKIRQQLQVLRECGVLEFLGRGRYRQVRWCPNCGADLAPDALPRNGSGHRRLACPECGAWLWE